MPTRRKPTPLACGLTAAGLALAAALGLALAPLAWAAAPWDESPTQRRARLEAMDAAEKEKLARLKERFDSLSPQEQDRLRQLHHELAAAPDGEELFHVLRRYCEWLKTIAPAERDKLARLPKKERIAEVREILKRQEDQRLSRFAQLTYEEGQAIRQWLGEMVKPHEDELLELLSPLGRKSVLKIDDPEARRRRLASSLIYERKGDKLLETLQPTRDDLTRLLVALAEPTRNAFRRHDNDPEQQQSLLRRWIFAVHFRPEFFPVSGPDLHEFFTRLPAEQKAELERLPREEMQRELRRRYFAATFDRGGRGGRGRPSYNPNVFGDRQDGRDGRREGREDRRDQDHSPMPPSPPAEDALSRPPGA